MFKIYDLETSKFLAEVSAKEFGKWCDTNKYLPHHKAGKASWIVVKC